MLNLDDPKSDFIFQASAYTDKIRGRCNTYILQNFIERQETFDEMEWFCLELRDFSEIHFSENFPQIKDLTQLIISEINRLRLIDETTETGKCTVCNSKIVKVELQMKDFPDFYYCSRCPKKIIDLLAEIDCYTGAIFI